MELQFKRKNKTMIILISGEVDHHTAIELRRQTESALAQMGGRNIIFGFEEVTFMDSSGIGMMIGRYKQLQALGGRIAIACANEKIAEIIRLSGLTKLLPVFDTIEEALQYTEGRETDAV
ncbi:STAS domain-containing protein [Anaerotignum sp.]